MEKLWAPWRMQYVGGPSRAGCVFCTAMRSHNDRDALVIHRGKHAFMILNLYPYNSGHAMIVPYEHVSRLELLTPDVRAELMELAELMVEATDPVLHPDGINLGLNIGEVAGAGVADHLHLHVVPRWQGDANFMPIVAATTVMPELLPVTYARLRAEIERIVVTRAGGIAPQAGAVAVLPDERRMIYRRAQTGEVLIPKGHIERDESAAQAAVRELDEETGAAVTLVGWAGSHRYLAQPGASRAQDRHVSFFLATGERTAALERHLSVDTVLVPVEDAVSALSVPAQQEIVAAVYDDLLRLTGEST